MELIQRVDALMQMEYINMLESDLNVTIIYFLLVIHIFCINDIFMKKFQIKVNKNEITGKSYIPFVYSSVAIVSFGFLYLYENLFLYVSSLFLLFYIFLIMKLFYSTVEKILLLILLLSTVSISIYSKVLIYGIMLFPILLNLFFFLRKESANSR